MVFGWFRKIIRQEAGVPATFPYPYEIVSGELAHQRLLSLRASGRGTPIILGGPEQFDRIEGLQQVNHATPGELLALAAKLDPIRWLEEREHESPALFDVVESDWPEHVTPNQSLSANLDVHTREPLDQVYIAVLPDHDAWKTACFLKVGGWNAMPSAPEHSALWRFWENRYGAKVACVADDVIEFTVERPPQTREEALELAKQQFIYCDDIVYQGVGSLEALAATILKAGVWYFWWD